MKKPASKHVKPQRPKTSNLVLRLDPELSERLDAAITARGLGETRSDVVRRLVRIFGSLGPKAFEELCGGMAEALFDCQHPGCHRKATSKAVPHPDLKPSDDRSIGETEKALRKLAARNVAQIRADGFVESGWLCETHTHPKAYAGRLTVTLDMVVGNGPTDRYGNLPTTSSGRKTSPQCAIVEAPPSFDSWVTSMASQPALRFVGP